MVSSENPEGVTSMITGREWNTVCGSSLLLQEHPELLITEIDMEEDRDREIYINIMREQKARDDENNASITTVPSTSSSSSSSSSSSVSILGAEIENVLKSNDINDNPEENQMDAVDKDNSENQSNNNIMIDNKINIDQLSLNSTSTSTSTSIRNMKSEVENNHDDHNSLKINLKSSSHPESLERSSATVVKINDIMSSSKVAIGEDQRSRKTSEEDEEQGEEEGDDADEEDDDDGEEEILEEGMGIAVDSVGVNIGTDAEEMTRKAFEEAFNNESDDDDDDDDDDEEEEGGGEEEGKEDNNGNESENEGEYSESGNIMIETPEGSLLGNKQMDEIAEEEEEEEEEDIDNDGEEGEEEEEEEVEEEGNEIGSKNFEMITDTNLDKAEAETEAGAIEEATGDEEREEEDEDEDDDDWMNVV